MAPVPLFSTTECHFRDEDRAQAPHKSKSSGLDMKQKCMLIFTMLQDSRDKLALSFAHTTAQAWLKNQDSSKGKRKGSLVNTLICLLGHCQPS